MNSEALTNELSEIIQEESELWNRKNNILNELCLYRFQKIIDSVFFRDAKWLLNYLSNDTDIRALLDYSQVCITLFGEEPTYMECNHRFDFEFCPEMFVSITISIDVIEVSFRSIEAAAKFIQKYRLQVEFEKPALTDLKHLSKTALACYKLCGVIKSLCTGGTKDAAITYLEQIDQIRKELLWENQ